MIQLLVRLVNHFSAVVATRGGVFCGRIAVFILLINYESILNSNAATCHEAKEYEHIVVLRAEGRIRSENLKGANGKYKLYVGPTIVEQTYFCSFGCNGPYKSN